MKNSTVVCRDSSDLCDLPAYCTGTLRGFLFAVLIKRVHEELVAATFLRALNCLASGACAHCVKQRQQLAHTTVLTDRPFSN